MTPDLVVPPAIQAAIEQYEQADAIFTEMDVSRALGTARASLENPSPPENLGAWAEVLAFGLVHSRSNTSPWGTFFAPLGSSKLPNGTIVYHPDIAGTPKDVIPYWIGRAKSARNPILKARYADLAWEMCGVIADLRRDVEMARVAIDSYIASIPRRAELHDKCEAALRALDLSSLIFDDLRIVTAKAALLELHQQAMAAKRGMWWVAFDRLIGCDHPSVTDDERLALVNDVEQLVVRFSDTNSHENFDPHGTQEAAERLIKYYRRRGQPEDVRRHQKAIAVAFEHFAGLGDAMLASAALQTAVNAYRDAGLADDSKRVRILMQEKIGKAREQMASIEHKFEIPRETMEKFLAQTVVNDPGATFVRIAAEFLSRRKELEKQVQDSLEQAPLMAHMPRAIMADDHVVARIGSVEDDPFGRLIAQTSLSFNLSNVWLRAALETARDRHKMVPEHFAGWANRLGIFDDITLVLEGVRAWYQLDFLKAVHLLVPQVEQGLRGIVGKLGKPVTKAHPKVDGASVAIGLGDILYSTELTEALGPDLTIYFQALYADPRGYNLRNELAHGLLKAEAMDGSIVRWLIHTLLVFGLWEKLAEKRR